MNNKPIRILHVLGLFDYGGAESLIMNVFRNVDRTKIMFDFVVHSEKKGAFEGEAQNLGSQIYRVSKYTGKNHFSYIKEWENIFNEHPEYEIIHGHVRSTASIYLKIAKKHGLKAIAHSHSISSGTGIEAVIKNVMQKGIRKYADYYFACSVEAGKWLFGDDIINNPNFYIMKNAIDASKFIFNTSIRMKMQKKLGLANQVVVGHIGRLHPSKNHERVLNIFKEFQKSVPFSHLLLIGDGELKENIEHKIKELNLNDKVTMLGSRQDTNDLLQAMDVLLFPSLYEGLGISIVEAQANSLACVISDVIPIEAVFTNNIVSSLSLNEDDSFWVSSMCEAVNKNREYIVTLEDVKKANYDIEEVSHWYANFMNTI